MSCATHKLHKICTKFAMCSTRTCTPFFVPARAQAPAPVHFFPEIKKNKKNKKSIFLLMKNKGFFTKKMRVCQRAGVYARHTHYTLSVAIELVHSFS